MTTKFLKFSILLTIAIASTSCKDKTTEANTSDAEAAAVSASTSQKYTANVAESSIEWKGFKPTGAHNGTINLDNGIFKTDDGKLQSGTFLIDMTSITVTDLESGDGKESLESHLKGTIEGKENHFFDTVKFPSAEFEITGTEASAAGQSRLSGNLSIKGQKHNISFPVTITNNGDLMTIESEAFTIDRTKWGVNYGSKSIFDDLGDKFVNDDMELKIMILAKKS
ncbi:YceI family protein [Psychroserpens burtonensis]|uniref:YceI family protein n=1 Tax=Psychroserpens burtonensis TaxID=49278 RepID=A0A5C7BB11_9FLAO|nr:YceI family protein [Psychroserpens burtonensis]TXE19896.1 YceI family protein [Psychroserpens burtonensis]